MKTKNFFSAIFAYPYLMLTLMLTFTSCASEELKTYFTSKNQDGVSYSLDNDKFEATAYGYYVKDGIIIKEIVLPAEVEAGSDKFNVVAVADRAFADGPWVSVTIGKNVRTLGYGAFVDCNDIKTVKLEGTQLPLLPENAFEQTVYDNAKLIVSDGVDVTGTGWEKFVNVSDK